MADTNPIRMQGVVNQDSPRAIGEGLFTDWKASKRGEACVIDFYTEMALEGRGYQVRAGVLTTPVAGDADITNLAAEMAVDAGQGLAVIPVYLNLAVAVGTATLYEWALKTVGTASSGGTVFTPLLLLGDTNGPAAVATARAQATGNVVVTADAITTTRVIWHGAGPLSRAIAGSEQSQFIYEPRTPHTIANDACCYLAVAADTTGPDYFASLDWIELLFANIS